MIPHSFLIFFARRLKFIANSITGNHDAIFGESKTLQEAALRKL